MACLLLLRKGNKWGENEIEFMTHLLYCWGKGIKGERRGITIKENKRNPKYAFDFIFIFSFLLQISNWIKIENFKNLFQKVASIFFKSLSKKKVLLLLFYHIQISFKIIIY